MDKEKVEQITKLINEEKDKDKDKDKGKASSWIEKIIKISDILE